MSEPSRPQLACVADVHQWGSVALRFAALDNGVADLLFVFDAEHVYPAALIFESWKALLAARWILVQNLRSMPPAKRKSIAGATQLRAWVAQTKSMAGDAAQVFGSDMSSALRAAATEAEESLCWPALRFRNPPADPLGLADLFWGAALWAHDRVRAACAEQTSSSEFTRARFVQTLVDGAAAAGVATPSQEAWTRTIIRFEERILPGQADAVIEDILSALARN
jgi:hypothetical protein